MTSQMRSHMDAISSKRQSDLAEIVGACRSNDALKIVESANRLAIVSCNYLLAAFELSYRQTDREGPSQLLVCVGSELLLNAIAVRRTPSEYATLFVKNKSPGFEKLKSCCLPIIVDGMSEKQTARMIDVLDLIHNKRNIFAHLSTGFHAYYYQHYEILNVVCHLLGKHFPQLQEEGETLAKIKERFRPKTFENYDYVSFDLDV